MVNVQLTRQREAKAHHTRSTTSLTHSPPKLCRSVVATSNGSTPLSVTLDAALCVVVGMVQCTSSGVRRPVPTFKAPCTHTDTP